MQGKCLPNPEQSSSLLFLVTEAVCAHIGKHNKLNKNCPLLSCSLLAVDNRPHWSTSDGQMLSKYIGGLWQIRGKQLKNSLKGEFKYVFFLLIAFFKAYFIHP